MDGAPRGRSICSNRMSDLGEIYNASRAFSGFATDQAYLSRVISYHDSPPFQLKDYQATCDQAPSPDLNVIDNLFIKSSKPNQGGISWLD